MIYRHGRRGHCVVGQISHFPVRPRRGRGERRRSRLSIRQACRQVDQVGGCTLMFPSVCPSARSPSRRPLRSFPKLRGRVAKNELSSRTHLHTAATTIAAFATSIVILSALTIMCRPYFHPHSFSTALTLNYHMSTFFVHICSFSLSLSLFPARTIRRKSAR